MATRRAGEIDPNSIVQSPRQSPSGDVWTPINDVIGDWSLGSRDLWARLVNRHEEILRTGAITCNLFQQLNFGVPCTCRKDETGQINMRCRSCFGASFIGGFEKFGFNTIFVGPTDTSIGGVIDNGVLGGTTGGTDDSGPTLTNLVVKHKLPDQLEIADGFTTGTLVSPAFQITGNLGYNSSQLSGHDVSPVGRPLPTANNFLVEFTIDGGTTWTNLFTGDTSLLNAPALIVRYRVTLTREKVSDPSPIFILLRSRFQTARVTNILISKRTFPEQRVLESFGVRVGADGITWWTTPSMGLGDGSEHAIQENDVFEIVSGRYKREPPTQEEYPDSGRFKPSNVTYVEPFGRFLSQRFNIRLVQTDEPEEDIF